MERPRRSIPPAIRGAILIPEQKISVYVSVLNEVDSIDRLLESMAGQTRPPSELLVIDGGSDDGTIERVERFRAAHANVRLMRFPGSSIAQARNLGFSSSAFDLVASIDAGCTADARWLESLASCLGPEVDIVSGVYGPDAKTLFERCVGDLMYPRVDLLPNDWAMPSHRSVLVRKRVWEALGGFPPNLDRSEDTWFDLEAARRGFRFRLARNAMVYWRPRRNLVEVFRNTYRWTSSDVEHSIATEPSAQWRLALERLGGAIVPTGWCLSVVTTVAISPWLGLSSFLFLTILMARPFRVVRRFRDENSVLPVVWKNLILLTNSAAWVLGYVHGLLRRTARATRWRKRGEAPEV